MVDGGSGWGRRVVSGTVALLAGVVLALSSMGEAEAADVRGFVPAPRNSCSAGAQVVDQTTGEPVPPRSPPADVPAGDVLRVTIGFNPDFGPGPCVGPVDVYSEPGTIRMADAFSDGFHIEYTILVAPDAAAGSEQRIVFSTPRTDTAGTTAVLISQVVFRVAGGTTGGSVITLEPGWRPDPPASTAPSVSHASAASASPRATPPAAAAPATSTAPTADSRATVPSDDPVASEPLANTSAPAALPLGVWVAVGIIAILAVIGTTTAAVLRRLDRRRRYRRMADH
ncbi:hypothetical protein [Leifsonia shinshuensis]